MAKKYTCLIENKEVNIKDGFTISDEMNETLDSGFVDFVALGGEIDLEAFDTIVFESEVIQSFSRKKQIVDTYLGEVYCFKNSLDTSDYKYRITIFSETKALERITLPNLAITKRANGDPYTVFEMVFEYCKRYLPQLKFFDPTNNEIYYSPCFLYDQELATRLSMECPEFVWNTPTLREVLNDLFSVADLIPVVKENVLTFIDLAFKGNQIDTSKLTNKQVSGTSADYCDSLTLPMKNIISTKPVVKKERICLHSDIGEITTNNAVFMTSKPIYNIRKFVLYVLQSAPMLYKRDITSFVIERKEFELLSNKIIVDHADSRDDFYLNNKCSHFWFERGNNTINNILTEYTTMENFISPKDKEPCYAHLFGYLISSHTAGSFAQHPLDIFAEIEYETIEETTINVSKKAPIRHLQNSLFDSQQASNVNIENQTIFEYAKANRLGNKILVVYGEYFSENDVPQLADRIGDKVLFSREITYYDDIIYFKGTLIDNYVLRDYFTGITSKRRSWNIADTNEAINRDDIYKIFVKFENQNNATEVVGNYPWSFKFTKINGTTIGDNEEEFDYNSFVNYTVLSTLKNLYTIVSGRTTASDGEHPATVPIIAPNTQAILESMQYSVAYSLEITARMPDNFKYGDKVVIEDDMHLQDPLRYVDENGECYSLKLNIGNGINEGGIIDFEANLTELLTTYDETKYESVIEQVRQRPFIFDVSNSTYNLQLNIDYGHKDNREILGSIVQFEYVSNDKNIIVGEKLSKCVSAGAREIANADIRIIVKTNYKFSLSDRTATGTKIAQTLNFNNNVITLPTSVATIGENDAWCIVDKNTNEILLAVNGMQAIYVQFRYTREENVYHSEVERVKIGTIYNTNAELLTEYNKVVEKVSYIRIMNRVIDVSECLRFTTHY